MAGEISGGSNVNPLSDLPLALSSHILFEWIDVITLSKLDNAYTNKELRSGYLENLKKQKIQHVDYLAHFFTHHQIKNYRVFDNKPDRYPKINTFLLLDWFHNRDILYSHIPILFMPVELNLMQSKHQALCSYPQVQNVCFNIGTPLLLSQLEIIFQVLPNIAHLHLYTGLIISDLTTMFHDMVQMQPTICNTLQTMRIQSICTHDIRNLEDRSYLLTFLDHYGPYIRYFRGVSGPSELIASVLDKCPLINFMDIDSPSAWDAIHSDLRVETLMVGMFERQWEKLQYFSRLQYFCSARLLNTDVYLLFLSLLQHCKSLHSFILAREFAWIRYENKINGNSSLVTSEQNKYYSTIKTSGDFGLEMTEDSVISLRKALSLLPAIKYLVLGNWRHAKLPMFVQVTLLHEVQSTYIEHITVEARSLSKLVRYNLPNLKQFFCKNTPKICTSLSFLLILLKKYTNIEHIKLPGIDWIKSTKRGVNGKKMKVNMQVDDFCKIERVEHELQITMRGPAFCMDRFNLWEPIESDTFQNQTYYSSLFMDNKMISDINVDESQLSDVLELIPQIGSIFIGSPPSPLYRKMVDDAIASSKHNDFLRCKYKKAAQIIVDAVRKDTHEIKDLHILGAVDGFVNIIQPNIDLFPPITAISVASLDFMPFNIFSSFLTLQSFPHLQSFMYNGGLNSICFDSLLFQTILQHCPQIYLIFLASFSWIKRSGKASGLGSTIAGVVPDGADSPMLMLIKGQFKFDRREALSCFQTAIEMSPKLRNLTISNEEKDMESLSSLFAILQHVHHVDYLVTLSLPGTAFLDFVTPQASSFTHLTNIFLDQCNERFWERWRVLVNKASSPLRSLKLVVSISFSGASGMSISDVKSLVHCFPKLTTLRITGAQNLDKLSFIMEMKQLGKQPWKYVNLNGEILTSDCSANQSEVL